jgi:hypothetical protein
MTNDTYLQIGEKLQLAIDTFKTVLRPADWWKRRSKTIADFGTRYLNARGSTPSLTSGSRCTPWPPSAAEAEAIIRDESNPIDSSRCSPSPRPSLSTTRKTTRGRSATASAPS